MLPLAPAAQAVDRHTNRERGPGTQRSSLAARAGRVAKKKATARAKPDSNAYAAAAADQFLKCLALFTG